MAGEKGGGRSWFNPFRKPEAKESIERQTRERVSAVILQSFFASQGNGNLQVEILNAYLTLHPEALNVVRDWGKELGYVPPDFSKFTPDDKEYYRTGITNGVPIEQATQKSLLVDEKKIASDPVASALVQKMVMFQKAPWHPLGDAVSRQATEEQRDLRRLEFAQNEFQRRLSQMATIAWLHENRKEKLSPKERKEVIGNFVKNYIGWDLKKATKVRESTDEVYLEHKRNSGVSFLCKYALSKDAAEARVRFPEELRDVWAAAGEYIRERLKTGEEPLYGLDELLKYWKEETGEEIELTGAK